MLITKEQELQRFYAKNRIWQGISSIEVTPKGRIFVTFYSGGTKEEFGNFTMIIKSDDGVNYSEPIAVTYMEGYRCFDPCLWIDPLGRLWYTWGIAPEDAVYASICDDPDADEVQWCEPFKIGHDVMMNKPVVLSTGEWLFPLAVWNWDVRTLAPEYDSKTPEKGSFVYKSSDNGKTFVKLGKADVPRRHFDEHMVVELRDGSLMMLVRTRYGIGVSYSYDRGKTWTEGVDSGLGGPSSRFFIGRLRSGRLLLINHVNFTGRNNLTALLSDDDGKTWSKGLLLDGRSGVSYPDATEGEDGYIYITYDRGRGAYKKTMEEALACPREILVARVTEEDILKGAVCDPASYLARVVSKLGEYAGEDRNPYGEYTRYSDKELAAVLAQTGDKDKIISGVFDHYPVPCYAEDNAKLDALIDAFEAKDSVDEKLLVRIIGLTRRLSRQEEMNPTALRIRNWVDKRFYLEWSLTEMAEALGVSRFYMCHLFKKEFGLAILEYRNSLRMTIAKQRLISTDDQIGVIAVECGFGTASYFGEVFQAAEGMSPSQYRKMH